MPKNQKFDYGLTGLISIILIICLVMFFKPHTWVELLTLILFITLPADWIYLYRNYRQRHKLKQFLQDYDTDTVQKLAQKINVSEQHLKDIALYGFGAADIKFKKRYELEAEIEQINKASKNIYR